MVECNNAWSRRGGLGRPWGAVGVGTADASASPALWQSTPRINDFPVRARQVFLHARKSTPSGVWSNLFLSFCAPEKQPDITDLIFYAPAMFSWIYCNTRRTGESARPSAAFDKWTVMAQQTPGLCSRFHLTTTTRGARSPSCFK